MATSCEGHVSGPKLSAGVANAPRARYHTRVSIGVSTAEARQCEPHTARIMCFLGLEEVQVSSHSSLSILAVREPSSRIQLRAGLNAG
jgi:hypothetical protein